MRAVSSLPLFTHLSSLLHINTNMRQDPYATHYLIPQLLLWCHVTSLLLPPSPCHLSTATSLVCKSEQYTSSSTFLAPKSEPEVDLCHILTLLACPLTLQGCTAASIDACTALVRSLGQFWSHTRMRVCVPPGFLKPLPQPVKTRTLWCGYRFA